MTRRAAIYCRISQDREGAGLGVERQREDCEKLAASLGWEVLDVITDNDVSAYSGKPRPGYRKLMARIDSGEIDAVLAWHTDRLHRSPRELEDYIALCERRGISTRTVTAGELDLSTPNGRAAARTLGAWARAESEHKSERIRRKHEQSAMAGRWRGGGRPFGWDVAADGSATLNEAEAAIVRDAAAAILSGVSLGSIIADLNGRGVMTSRGKRWAYTQLRQVLERPRNAGHSELRGEIVGKSTWPAILDDETWRAVVALLRNPARRKSQSNRVRHLLSGIAVCGGGTDGDCGGIMRPSGVGSGPKTRRVTRTVYRCTEPGIGHVSRAVEPLDDLVSRLVIARLNAADVGDLLAPDEPGADVTGLTQQAAALRQRLNDLTDMFAAGEIDRAQLARANAKVRDSLEVTEQQMATAARGLALAEFSRGRPAQDVWDALTIERRRQVVAELARVVVLPQRRGRDFDPAAVRIEWRTE